MKIIHDWRWSFRLLPDALQELRVVPQGVIHIGAHLGQEVPIYLECGFSRITLVEADPDNCAAMAGAPWIDNRGVGIVNKAGGPAGKATFHRAESAAFSGLRADSRQPKTASFPIEVVPASEVQSMHGGNVLVIDTQGTELDVLATARLDPLDLIIIETQTKSRNGYAAYFDDLLAWCTSVGWRPAIQWLREHGGADTLLVPQRVSNT